MISGCTVALISYDLSSQEASDVLEGDQGVELRWTQTRWRRPRRRQQPGRVWPCGSRLQKEQTRNADTLAWCVFLIRTPCVVLGQGHSSSPEGEKRQTDLRVGQGCLSSPTARSQSADGSDRITRRCPLHANLPPPPGSPSLSPVPTQSQREHEHEHKRRQSSQAPHADAEPTSW